MNTSGFFLTTEGPEVLETLQGLSQDGVKILSLWHPSGLYGPKDKLGGRRGYQYVYRHGDILPGQPQYYSIRKENTVEIIYMDNAATSYPKPEAVYEAVDRFNRFMGGNPGRGKQQINFEAGSVVLQTREAMAKLF